MDIAFFPPIPREDIYFCLECKRLNVVDADGNIRPYNNEYVTNGMVRFIKGQYSKNVRHGGMLGYVLDGNITDAMTKIAKSIKYHHTNLIMEAPGVMMPSTASNDEHVKETKHSREFSEEAFHIHHLFVKGG